MSGKLLWCGLTLLVATPVLGLRGPFEFLGAVLMVVGSILLLLDK